MSIDIKLYLIQNPNKKENAVRSSAICARARVRMCLRERERERAQFSGVVDTQSGSQRREALHSGLLSLNLWSRHRHLSPSTEKN